MRAPTHCKHRFSERVENICHTNEKFGRASWSYLGLDDANPGKDCDDDGLPVGQEDDGLDNRYFGRALWIYLGLDDANPGKDCDDDGLPEGEKDDGLDDDELGERADGGQLLLGRHEHKDEAVQGPQLTEVVHQRGVQVHIVQPQLALLVHSALLRDERCTAMHTLSTAVLQLHLLQDAQLRCEHAWHSSMGPGAQQTPFKA